MPFRNRAGFALLGILVSSAVSAQAPAKPAVSPPISLRELFSRVRTHPRIAAAEARSGAARGDRRSAGVLPNPVFGLALENAALPGREPVPGMDREVMTTASFPLEFVYQRGPRVRRASAELDASAADARTERQAVALDAARAYYGMALAEVGLATALDLAAWFDSLLVYHERRAEEGLTAEGELIRVRLERERARSEVALQRAELARARAELVSFYGDSVPGSGTLMVTTPDAPLRLPEAEIGPATWTARPEVEASQARLRAARSGVGTAVSLIVPEFSATAGIKRSGGASTLLAGLSVPIPLLNQNGGQQVRARAEREAAGYELVATERRARAELSAAREAARALSDRVEALAGPAAVAPGETGPPMTFLERAEATRQLALEAHREGAIPLIQVLDAARAWGEARMSYYRTLYAQHESALLLLLAEGRDLLAAVAGPDGGQ